MDISEIKIDTMEQKSSKDTNDFEDIYEVFNINTSREEELKRLQKLEEKLNREESYEIKVLMTQKSLKKLHIDENHSEKQSEVCNKETQKKMENKETNENREKNENHFESTQRNHKRYTKDNSIKRNNFIRPRVHNNNGFRKIGYGMNYFPGQTKPNYFERGYRRGQRGSRLGTRFSNYHGRYKPLNRPVFPSRREMEDVNYYPGFKREKPKEANKDDRLINYQSLIELVPATMEDEESMLREAIQLSKQQMFIERLQQKQLEKVLQSDEQTSKSLQVTSAERKEKDEINPSNFNNTKNFNSHENGKEKFQKKFLRREAENKYKSKCLENTQSSRESKIINTYQSTSKFRDNNNITENHQRKADKSLEHTKVTSRLFISSIRSIKQSNSSIKTSTDSQIKNSKASSEEIKNKEGDVDWNNIASNDLKTMLHIGHDDTKTSVKKETKYLNETANNTSNSINKSSEENQNTRKNFKCDYKNNKEQRDSSYHFLKNNSNFCYKRGNMQRRRNYQRHYGNRNGDRYNTYVNYKEPEWRPYGKHVEEGKFDNVPPRFKKMYK